MNAFTPVAAGWLSLLIGSAVFAQQEPPIGDLAKFPGTWQGNAGPVTDHHAPDKASYERARARAGRSADAHVRLALWCEAGGLEPEQRKHLTIATLLDPDHAAARGLKGQVRTAGQWRRPQDVEAQTKSDKNLSETLAEYDRLRVAPVLRADDHWKLALWCEEHNLEPQSLAHLRAVVRLDPTRKLAWTRLGYGLHDGRWLTAEQFRYERTEKIEQQNANKTWLAFLAARKRELQGKESQDTAEKALAGVIDRRAVPAIWRVFALGNASDHTWAVQLLGQVHHPAASRALAILAVFSPSPKARRAATETLAHRDPYAAVGPIISLLGDTAAFDPDPRMLQYQWRLEPIGSTGIGSLGALLVESPWFDLFTTYTVDESLWRSGSANATPMTGYQGRIIAQRQRQLNDLDRSLALIADQTQSYLTALDTAGLPTRQFNARTIQILRTLTKQDLGEDREAWRKWWLEEQGYAYVPPRRANSSDTELSFGPKPFFTSNVHLSCFAAGTVVRTLTGLRPIEKLRIGDQVLTQEPTTGTLSYQTIEDIAHNPPDETLRVQVGAEIIETTGIHRFWKIGQGWVMARELRRGDAVRTVAGAARVVSLKSGRRQPVYNLLVPGTHSFFVGDPGVLVHDNGRLTPKPVDRESPVVLANAPR